MTLRGNGLDPLSGWQSLSCLRYFRQTFTHLGQKTLGQFHFPTKIVALPGVGQSPLIPPAKACRMGARLLSCSVPPAGYPALDASAAQRENMLLILNDFGSTIQVLKRRSTPPAGGLVAQGIRLCKQKLALSSMRVPPLDDAMII